MPITRMSCRGLQKKDNLRTTNCLCCLNSFDSLRRQVSVKFYLASLACVRGRKRWQVRLQPLRNCCRRAPTSVPAARVDLRLPLSREERGTDLNASITH